MDWIKAIDQTLEYIESHLFEKISVEEMAKKIYISPFYLQKGFTILTGYSIGEYIKNRRLYCIALELSKKRIKVIDAAYRCFYETPESFTKAFIRFHGVTPTALIQDPSQMKPFYPLHITIEIKGGNKMYYQMEKMSSFQVVGFCRRFHISTSYQEIPLFWAEITETYAKKMRQKPFTALTTLEAFLVKNKIGELGICIDNEEDGYFTYMIGGFYTGGDIPDGLEKMTIPEANWAKFNCIGPLPEALQAVNTRIFKEWLPGNSDFEIAMGISVEWYSSNEKTEDANYQSAIWIPVNRK